MLGQLRESAINKNDHPLSYPLLFYREIGIHSLILRHVYSRPENVFNVDHSILNMCENSKLMWLQNSYDNIQNFK